MDDFARLTDDLVAHILSFLPTDDAAATSILSTRWRYLWKLTRRIIITPDFLAPAEANEEERLRKVDSVLSAFDDPISFPVDKISIEDDFEYFNVASVERWISFALDRHDVEVFNLFLSPWECKCRFPPPSLEPRNYRLTDLGIEYCKFLPNFQGFRNLRHMSLYGCEVPDSAFASIERNCTFLESLKLSDIHGLENLRISSNRCHLSHLNIHWFRHLKSLVIDSPHLAFLTYIEGSWRLPAAAVHRIRAPRLKEADFRLDSAEGASSLALIQSITGEIEMLRLQLKLELGQRTDFSRYHPLSYVKELVLGVLSEDLTGLDALLRVSSGLECLWLSFHFSLDNLLVVPLAGFKHQNLQKIQMVGFSCRPDHLQLLRYLVEVAVQLDEMQIAVEADAVVVASTEEYIKRGIEDKLPCGAKLVVLRLCRV